MNKGAVRVPTVLVVDDDEMTRLIVKETLEAEGLRVEEARNGEQGIEAFRLAQPDLVLLDINMPGMDGFDCCERLRSTPDGERVSIVIFTGSDDDESITRAYEVGATDFIPKPLHPKLFGHRVRYLLRAGRALEQLARSEASLAHAQRLAHVGNWEWRPASNDGYWSDEVYRILGVDTPAAPSWKAFLRLVPREERAHLIAAFAALLRQGTRYSLEHRIVRPNGEQRIVLQQAEAVQDAGGHPFVVRGTLQDLTQRKQVEHRIQKLAYFDTLTGLPNRVQFKDQLARSLRRAETESTRVAVMFLDVDQFKRINDTLGHQIGDQLLNAVAGRLTSSVRGTNSMGRSADDVSLARLGGDEFTLAFGGISGPEDAAKIAQRLLEVLSRRYSIAGHELFVTGSIGIAISPADGNDVDTLLKSADMAMYCAKDRGRNNFQFYSEDLSTLALERLSLERDLHQAVERGELLLHYQPQIDASSNRIFGVEALVRWHHPHRGLVPPATFIPIAEQSGLILPIGEWVLEEACRQVRAWREQGLPPLKVSVNVSGAQFRDEKLADTVARALDSGRLHSSSLMIEATETIMMESGETTLKTLRDLKRLGVGIAIDDFGTGYSSLAYLKRFPLDVLKIDRSFVRDLDAGADDTTIVAAIIAMANSLKLRLLAEGVETPRQKSALLRLGCTRMQGYLFGRPVSPDKIPAIIEKSPEMTS